MTPVAAEAMRPKPALARCEHATPRRGCNPPCAASATPIQRYWKLDFKLETGLSAYTPLPQGVVCVIRRSVLVDPSERPTRRADPCTSPVIRAREFSTRLAKHSCPTGWYVGPGSARRNHSEGPLERIGLVQLPKALRHPGSGPRPSTLYKHERDNGFVHRLSGGVNQL